MVRRETWFLLVVLAALVGFAVYLNRQKTASEAQATPTGAQEFVFPQGEGLPESIEITPADGEPVRIARNEEKIWAIELPFPSAANQGLSEAASTQVSSLRILDEIQGALDIFGLDKPANVIKVRFAGGSEHVLDVGAKTPTNSGYYTRLDKKKMLIVSLSSLESLLNLVTAPPYLETPTPSAIPATSTPELIPGQTATPTP